MPNPNKSYIARLGRMSGYGRRVFSWKGALKTYQTFHTRPGVAVQPYRSTPRHGDFVKMNAATSLSRAVQAGVLSRVGRGRYQAVKGAFAAGHKFWGNQYTKISRGGLQGARTLIAQRARLNRTMLSWAAKNQTKTHFANVRWVNKPIPFSFFAKRAGLAGKVSAKALGWVRHS